MQVAHRSRLAAVAMGLGIASLVVTPGVASAHGASGDRPRREVSTTTPIKHLVVIFQENVSFDHYFATYPQAANTDGTTVHRVAPARRPRITLASAAC